MTRRTVRFVAGFVMVIAVSFAAGYATAMAVLHDAPRECDEWTDIAIRCGVALDKCGARAYPDWYTR